MPQFASVLPVLLITQQCFVYGISLCSKESGNLSSDFEKHRRQLYTFNEKYICDVENGDVKEISKHHYLPFGFNSRDNNKTKKRNFERINFTQKKLGNIQNNHRRNEIKYQQLKGYTEKQFQYRPYIDRKSRQLEWLPQITPVQFSAVATSNISKHLSKHLRATRRQIRVPPRRRLRFENNYPKSKNTHDGIDLGKIFNGYKINIEERPWSAFIMTTKTSVFLRKVGSVDDVVQEPQEQITDPPQHLCTASLVGGRFVVTAAHCFDPRALTAAKYEAYITPLEVIVSIGQTDQKDVKGMKVVIKKNKNLFFHKDYVTYLDRSKFKARYEKRCSYYETPDIVILKLPKHVFESDQPGNDIAKVIRFPQGEERQQGYFYGRQCFASGWGLTSALDKTKISLPVVPGTLYEINFTLTDPLNFKTKLMAALKHACSKKDISPESMVNESSEVLFFQLGDSSTPAVNEGDSGGPLACLNALGDFVLAGMINFGLQWRASPFSSSYERIDLHLRMASFDDWIKSVMRNNDFDDVEDEGSSTTIIVVVVLVVVAAAAAATGAALYVHKDKLPCNHGSGAPDHVEARLSDKADDAAQPVVAGGAPDHVEARLSDKADDAAQPVVAGDAPDNVEARLSDKADDAAQPVAAGE